MKKSILGKIVLMLALCFIVAIPAKAEEVMMVEYKKEEGASFKLKGGRVWNVKYKYDETIARDLEEWRLYDKNGKLLSDIVVPKNEILLHLLDDNNFRYEERGHYGLMNFQGKRLTEPIYDDITVYTKDRYKAVGNYKTFFLDKKGKEINQKYDFVGEFHNKRAVVRKEKRNEEGYRDTSWGVIDEKGKVIVKPSYAYGGIGSYSNNRAVVHYKDYKRAVIDEKGKEIVKPGYAYDEIYSYSNNRAVVKKDWEYGVIDEKGKVIVKPSYDYIYPYSHNRAVVIKNEKYGVIDEKGKVIVKPSYDSIQNYFNNRAVVEKDGKFGVIDMKGKVIVKPSYNIIYNYSNNRAVVWKKSKQYTEGGQYGVIDEKGKEIVKLNDDYMQIDSYSNNRAVVKYRDGKEGVIDTKGKVIVKPSDFYIRDCVGNYVLVEDYDLKYGIIDTKGKIIFKIEYDDIQIIELEGKKIFVLYKRED